MGYHLAGFDVWGVDHLRQPRYPFPLIEIDALYFLEIGGWMDFDIIHASPPCQAYSMTQRIQQREHPDLITPLRELLQVTKLPYVIENVPFSPLLNPIELCGSMFELKTYRHRLFESNISLTAPLHPPHEAPLGKMGRPTNEDEMIHVVGNFSGVADASEAMGIDWMSRDDLREAIPPAYTHLIGSQLLQLIFPGYTKRAEVSTLGPLR